MRGIYVFLLYVCSVSLCIYLWSCLWLCGCDLAVYATPNVFFLQNKLEAAENLALGHLQGEEIQYE